MDDDWDKLFKSMNISFKNIISKLEDELSVQDEKDSIEIRKVLNNYKTSKKYLSYYSDNLKWEKTDEIHDFIKINSDILNIYKNDIILDPDHEFYKDDPIEFKRHIKTVSNFLDESIKLIKKNKTSTTHIIKILNQIKRTNKAMLRFIHIHNLIVSQKS